MDKKILTSLAKNKMLSNWWIARLLLNIKLLFCSLLITSTFSFAEGSLTVNSNNKQEINKIKSAYIYNFLKYVDFGPDLIKPEFNNFTVCVFGEDQFEKSLDSLAGRKAKGLQVIVKRTKNQEELFDCQIVYISQSEESKFNGVLDTIKNYSILTVSEIKNFTKNGGIIGFDNRDNKIVIEINLKNAIKAEVHISAMLLEIATVVE